MQATSLVCFRMEAQARLHSAPRKRRLAPYPPMKQSWEAPRQVYAMMGASRNTKHYATTGLQPHMVTQRRCFESETSTTMAWQVSKLITARQCGGGDEPVTAESSRRAITLGLCMNMGWAG